MLSRWRLRTANFFGEQVGFSQQDFVAYAASAITLIDDFNVPTLTYVMRCTIANWVSGVRSRHLHTRIDLLDRS